MPSQDETLLPRLVSLVHYFWERLFSVETSPLWLKHMYPVLSAFTWRPISTAARSRLYARDSPRARAFLMILPQAMSKIREKENSEFTPTKLRLSIDLVKNSARGDGLGKHTHSPVGWDYRIHILCTCRGVRRPNQFLGYDTKSDGEDRGIPIAPRFTLTRSGSTNLLV